MIGRGKRVTARDRIDYFLIFDNQRKYEIKTQWTGTFMLFAIQETSGCLSDFFVMRHSYFLMSVKHDSSCWKLYDTLIILKLIDIYGWFRESIPNQTNMYAARVLSPHTWHCSTSLKRDVLCFFPTNKPRVVSVKSSNKVNKPWVGACLHRGGGPQVGEVTCLSI